MKFTSDQIEKLNAYVATLEKWQKTINLVSLTTLDDVWQRHIVDSAQIADLIPENAKLADMGSGAGFPGLVLAILRPDLAVSLIESDSRKCAFLSTVSRETVAKIKLVNERIEDLPPVSYDVITARALASLDKLLGLVQPFVAQNPDLICVFLKGAQSHDEIDAAQALYQFEYDVKTSVTDPEARIIRVWNIAPR